MRSPGSLLVLAGSISVAVAQWYLVWLFAREGGPSAVGVYSMLLAIATPLFIGVQLGLRSVYVTLRESYQWRTYLLLRTVGVAAGISVMAFITVVLPMTDGRSTILVAAIIVMKSSESFLDLYYSRFQRSRAYNTLGILSLANAAGTILLATLAVLWIGNVVAGVWASAFVSAVVAAFAIALSARRESQREQTSAEVREQGRGYRAVVNAGIPLAVAQLLVALAVYVPVMVVEFLGESSDVGVFAVASYLVVFANLVGASVATVALRSFALTASTLGRRSLLRRASRLVGASLIPGVFVIPLVAISGTPVLGFVYGSEYALTSSQLSLLAIASVAVIPGYLYSSVLQALNNYRGVTGASAVAAGAVLASSAVCIWADVSAVTAGCVVLCTGTFVRAVALFAWTHLSKGIADDNGKVGPAPGPAGASVALDSVAPTVYLSDRSSESD